jgi:hypothetical protein
MRRKGLSLTLGLACAAGLLGLWPSCTLRAAEAPEIKLLTREVSLGKLDPGMSVQVPGGTGWLMVMDSSQPAGPGGLERFRSLAVPTNGRRVAHVAVRDGKQSVVVDGLEGKEKEYDEIYASPGLLFSPDGRHVAYVAGRGGKELVVVDTVEGKEYVAARSPVFSPDSRRVAYAAVAGSGRSLVVVDGVEGKEYLDTYPYVQSTPVFSPDSKRVAYAACGLEPGREPTRPGFKCLVVVDGVEGNGYGSIEGPPVFSPDSRRVAYAAVAGSGEKLVVVDGVEGQQYGDIVASSLVFSPDSRRVAYVAERGGGKQFVVVDGVEGNEYGGGLARPGFGPTPGVLEGSLVFSPDSRRVAYLAQRGDKALVVVDGVEGKEYEGFLGGGGLVFDSPTQLHALAVSGGELFRVEIEIVTAGAGTAAPR